MKNGKRISVRLSKDDEKLVILIKDKLSSQMHGLDIRDSDVIRIAIQELYSKLHANR